MLGALSFDRLRLAALREQPLGKIDPLLEFGHPMMDPLEFGHPGPEMVHLGGQGGIGAPALEAPGPGPNQRHEDDP